MIKGIYSVQAFGKKGGGGETSQNDMKAERAKARANESLNAVCWFSAARMRDERMRSLSWRLDTRSIPLRAATYGDVSLHGAFWNWTTDEWMDGWMGRFIELLQRPGRYAGYNGTYLDDYHADACEQHECLGEDAYEQSCEETCSR